MHGAVGPALSTSLLRAPLLLGGATAGAHRGQLLLGQALITQAALGGARALPHLQQRPQRLQRILGQLRRKRVACEKQ